MQFFGRLASEYEAMFARTLDSFAGCTVLDCPSGPGSFVAELHQRGAHAIGVDPLYAQSLEALMTRGRADVATTIERMRSGSDAFRDHDFESYRASKLHALDAFAADYELGKAQGRYLAASLPHLPFADQQFDCTLSAHLLFTYSDPSTGGVLTDSPFTAAWHLAAAEELLRVTRHELRLYPTTTRWHTASRHPLALEIAAHFTQQGHAVHFAPSTFARGNDANDPHNACMVVTRGGASPR